MQRHGSRGFGPSSATSARAPRCRLGQQRGVHTQALSTSEADRRQLPSTPSWPPHRNHDLDSDRRHPALRRGAPTRLPPPLRALGGQFDNLPPIPTQGGDGEDDEDEEEEFFSRPLSSSAASTSSTSDALPPRLRPKRVRFRSFADDAASRDPPLPPCPVFGGFERRLSLVSSDGASSSPSPSSSPPLVLVRPLVQAEIPDAASLLTDGFAAAMGYPKRYRQLLRTHIVSYLRTHSRLSPAAVVLSARFVDEGEEDDEEREEPQRSDFSLDVAAASSSDDERQLLPPPPPLLSELAERTQPRPRLPGVLAGSVEVSLSSSTRTRSLTLNPPDDAAYLCNMAVHPALRGRGVGGALLSAAVDAARHAGADELFLHLRIKDADGPAGRLYARGGFVEAGRDSGLMALFSSDKRLLLRKAL